MDYFHTVMLSWKRLLTRIRPAFRLPAPAYIFFRRCLPGDAMIRTAALLGFVCLFAIGVRAQDHSDVINLKAYFDTLSGNVNIEYFYFTDDGGAAYIDNEDGEVTSRLYWNGNRNDNVIYYISYSDAEDYKNLPTVTKGSDGSSYVNTYFKVSPDDKRGIRTKWAITTKNWDANKISLWVDKWNRRSGTKDEHQITFDVSIAIPHLGGLAITGYDFKDARKATLHWASNDNSMSRQSYTVLYKDNGFGGQAIDSSAKGVVKGDFEVDQSNAAVSYYLVQKVYDNRIHIQSTPVKIPAFTHPTALTVKYNVSSGRQDINWTIPAVNGSDDDFIKSGFKLQHATQADFSDAVDLDLSGISYDKDQTAYTFSVDPSEDVYYRVARDFTQKPGWGWQDAVSYYYAKAAGITASSGVRLVLDDKAFRDTLFWNPSGLWPEGTSFIITRINKTTSGSTAIQLEKADYESGFYVDSLISPCNEYYYSLQVKFADNSGYKTEKPFITQNTVSPVEIGNVFGLQVSKGYFNDRTELSWKSEGLFDSYLVKRKVFGGSGGFVQIATVPGSASTELQIDDEKGQPGVYYQYMVIGVVNCNGKTTYSRDSLLGIGFRSPTGSIYGRVVYGNGQAVKDAAVRLESTDNTQLGQSVLLNGQAGSYLRVDSLMSPFKDSAFTIEAWIKPAEANPKNQVVFSREGQYELGFDSNGDFYFTYNGKTVSGHYSNPNDAYIHVAGINCHDSLMVMLNDSVIGVASIDYSATSQVGQAVYIGASATGHYFMGNIDEMRAWNIALPASQIARDYTRLMAGNEYGLIAYWRFDEIIPDQFYDLSHNNLSYNRNEGLMDSTLVARSSVIPTPGQLSLKAYTDSTGNYMISGIPYAGNGTTYSIVPLLGTHQFDPGAVNRLLSPSSTSFTVDFTDKSSFLVSGYVYYRNSTVPVQGAQFMVDDQYAQQGNGDLIQTDATGKFTISVPIGIHTVKALKANHVFVGGGKITDRFGHDLNYQGPVSERILYDSTTVRFIGRVAGGAIQDSLPLGHSLSKNNLGEKLTVTLNLVGVQNRQINATSTDSIVTVRHFLPSNQTDTAAAHRSWTEYKQYSMIIHPDSVTGEFFADIIPENFNVVSVTATGHDDLVAASPVNIDFTNAFAVLKEGYNYSDSTAKGVISYADSVPYNAKYKFTLRNEPVISVQQIDGGGKSVQYFGDTVYTMTRLDGTPQPISVYDQTTGKYLFGYPVWMQNKQYSFNLKAYEVYDYFKLADLKTPASTDHVPTRDGLASIVNNLEDGSASPDTLRLDSTGSAVYSFYPGAPELSDGVGRKGFSVSIKIGAQTIQWKEGKLQQGYVMGGKKTGNDFVTGGPDHAVFVLRDPPGANSFSTLSTGTSFTTTSEYQGTVIQDGNIDLKADLGAKIVTWVGVGGGVVNTVETKESSTVKIEHTESYTGTNTKVSTNTLLTSFQTSSDPIYVGAKGDVFIGNSTNIVCSNTLDLRVVLNKDVRNTDVVFWDGAANNAAYSIVQRTGINIGQTFGTMFAYPAEFITGSFIPGLEKLRNSFLLPKTTSPAEAQARANNLNEPVYVSKLSADDPNFGASNRDTKAFGPDVALEPWANGSSYKIYFPDDPDYNGNDTILYLNQSIANWEARLADNERIKIDALNNKTGFLQNYSFTGGSSVSENYTAEYSSTKSNSFKFVIGGGIVGKTGGTINGIGVIAEYSEKLSTEQGGNFSHGNTDTRSFGFTMADYLYNYLSVDVFRGSDSAYLFITKGGQTACPYEGPTVSQYYSPGTIIDQPTVQVEVPKITVDQSVVSSIPSNKEASYTLKMHNDTKVEGSGWFGLKVLDETNPYGAVIYMDGNELGTGRTILVPSGEILTKTITLRRGPDSMNYNNIKLVLYSLCETTKIGDTINISARFIPSCSSIDIKAPTDKWVVNSLSPVDASKSYYLPITLDDFDVNHSLFDHIELQYKPAADALWITAMKFFGDSARYRQAQGQKQMITENGKIEYNLVMNDASFSDQPYDIRAVGYCMDNGQVISTSESAVISGIKDTYTPRLFGSPQPANGVLGVGEDIRLNFNEQIAAGLLSHSDFKVTGIRNGAQGNHSVSVALDGQHDFLATQFDKNLTGKDITVELWLLAKNQLGGTIFSQGDINNSMELSLTDDGHIAVKVGTKTIQSERPVNYQSGQWAHIAMEYNAARRTVSAFYNYAEVISDAPADAYTGAGHFEFGRSIAGQGNYLAGQIHGARIWSKIVTPLNLQINSLTLLSGAENGLLAYYPMNEGKGNIIFDKAHGANARLTGNWSTPAGKSMVLNGNGYVKMNTASAPVTAAMDYTIGLWFKALPGQTNATLVSSGRGDGTDYGSSANLFNLGFENGLLTFDNNGFKIQATGNYLDNEWHQVALAVNRNAGIAQLYIDGILNQYADANNLGGIAAAFTYLGARAWLDSINNVTVYDRYFKGNVDEFRVWNTYLNQAMIDQNNNVRLAGNELGLLVYYPFETYFDFQNNKEMGFTLSDLAPHTGPEVTDAVAVNAAETDQKAPIIDRGPVDNLQFDYVVNDDALIINLTEPKQSIDKTIVTLQAKNIRDVNGNPIVSPITWTAYINQNQLKWSDDALDLSKMLNAKMQFQSYVVNTGGAIQNFRLDNLPPWLVAAPSSGTIAPLGKQLITFTVDAGLNVGTYDELVYLHNDNDEVASLPLTMRVKGEEPDWKVNPGDYKYNMTVFGKIRINNILSSDSSDILAAFVGGKCVGVAKNTYNTANDFWYTFLTVYSNNISGEDIEFRIWDGSTGKIFAGIPPSAIRFSNGSIIGTAREPVIFDGKEMLFQRIGLADGWNWISFNLQNTAFNDVGATLSNGSWLSGDIVKDIDGFDQYSSAEGWIGSLTGFNNTSLYMLNSAKAQTLSVSGTAIDVLNTPIGIKGGRWNYISYLPDVNMTVREALAGYDASNEDVIKSQTGFAMYDDQNGWVGNLTYLEPGKGYMLYRKATTDANLIYGTIGGGLGVTSDRSPGAGVFVPRAKLPLHAGQNPVAGNFKFAENMTLVAELSKDLEILPGDIVAAYINGELRSRATVIDNPLTDQRVLLFNISGTGAAPVYFTVERHGRPVATSDPVFTYGSNTRLGTLSRPFLLDFNTTAATATLYPNPFKDKVNINIRLGTTANGQTHKVQLSVYDISGKLIQSRPPVTFTGAVYQVHWDGSNAAGKKCGAGVYIINIAVDGRLQSFKVMKQ